MIAALGVALALVASACAADDSAADAVDAANAAVAGAEATIGEARGAAADAASAASSASAAATAAQAAAAQAQATAEGNLEAVEQAEAALADAQAAVEAALAQAEEAQAEAEVARHNVKAIAGDYEAVIRPASQQWTIGHADGLAGIPFTDSVTDSIYEVADAMGVDIIFCDNAYDQEKTVDCANLIVAQEADGVIFANWIAGTEELIAGIYIDAGLPCITWDGPHPGCKNFGPDNFEASVEAGRYLAGFAQEQGWDPAETELVVIWTQGVQVMGERRDGAIAGVLESFPIPEENIHVDIPHAALDDVFPLVTDWATANPDAKNVLCFGHSDQPGVDCALALEQAGFLGRAAVASLGASDEALVDLRQRSDEESAFKATISFFPERYGQYLVPAVVDMLEGRIVPDRVIPSVEPVTRANVQELYPG
ncbi:MAG: sugar ABC transporter substrate-binding protein [Acidimicrobiia bacterium]|nr:sugar ABC transporter substrate-binding protein [Acidimicrobiia bacterium]